MRASRELLFSIAGFVAGSAATFGVIAILGLMAIAQTLAVQPPMPPPADFMVFYDYGKPLGVGQRHTLNQAAVAAKCWSSDQAVLIRGHTDNSLKEEDSQRVSDEMARLVADELAARCVRRESITIESSGAKQPLFAGTDRSDEPQNRRVEITVKERVKPN